MIKYSSKSVRSSASCARRLGSVAARRDKAPALRNRLYGAVLLALSGVAQAVPQGGEVVAGDATIAVSGDTMNIQQNSQRAVINFESFDVGQRETVNFHQPGSDSVALNRVLGSNLSEIHGAINANGQVYLINPNGVLFGNGAQLNVGSLVVTTLDIADQDFLAGRDSFAGSAEGVIENHGTINAKGRVVLLAPEVINRGDIVVPGGDITLRASQQALLHSPGSEIPILVDSSEFVGHVTNEGNLQAGDVALVLDGISQRDVYDAAINNRGLVRAVHASGAGGSIELHAPGGDVVNSGTLDAGAVDGKGGHVALEAERVFQSGAVKATAAGAGDGGDINLHASEGILMHSGSAIDASADGSGDGGDVVVLADKGTWFTEDSSIQARGGEQSGDGGFVEVSGREFVSVAGKVDVGANDGENGLWFIDPTDITITDMDFNGNFTGSDPATWTLMGTPATSLINATTLRNTLSNDGDVLISSVSTGTGVGDITFDAALDYNGLAATHTLTLQAHNQVIFTPNGRIFDSNTASAEGLNFVAIANNGFTMASAASINAGSGSINITTTAGDATITGLISNMSESSAATAVQVYATGGRILDANPGAKDIDVPNGGFTLHAMGDIGDLMVESNYMDAVSTAGDITLHEEASTSVLRLETPGTVNMFTGVQFSVDLASPLMVNNLNVDAGTDFRVADTGFEISGDLTVIANSIRGGAATVGTTVTLSAANADITLRNDAPERSWTTSFDQLALDLSSNTGDFTLVDTDGLMLTSVTTGGNASFSSTNGDLAFTATPVVPGDLNLTTLGSGDLILPAGLTHTGNVTVLADNLLGSGTGVTLGAINADITLRDGAAPSTWTTSFDQLTLAIDGLSDLDLTDTDGLTLNSVNTAGSARFGATNADLVLTAAPVIGGNLGLKTVGSGNVVIPDTGLNYTGDLEVEADNLMDTDSDLTLTAANADIKLRDGTLARNWTTSLDQLALNLASTGEFTLVDTDGLTLTSVATGGNASFTTTNGDLALSSDSAVAGNLTLTASGSGDLVLPDTGFVHGGSLTVLADNLRDTTDTNIAIAAGVANITLRDGAGPSSWDTNFDQLSLDTAGAGALSLLDRDGLTLASVTTGGNASFAATGADLVLTATPSVAGDLGLNTIGGGNLIIPSARFTHNGGALVIDADDLLDPNRTLTLEAASADITLRNAGGNHDWATYFDSLSLAVTGVGDVNITDNDGLVLTDLAVTGNASFTANGADLVFSAAPAVAGDLSLTTLGSGNVVIADAGMAPAGNLTVLADNLMDSDSTLILGAANADITLRDGAGAHSWNTSFDQLVLDIAGTGALALTDSDELTLTSVATGGDAGFSTTNADLTLTSAPQVAGDLTLATIGSGDLIIPDTGLSHGGLLTFAADSVRDNDNALTFGADTLAASLRDQALATQWTTTVQSLDLSLTGGGALNLDNTGALTLTGLVSDSATAIGSTGTLQVDSVTTTGDLTLTSGGDLNLTNGVLGGDLQLTTAPTGELIIPETGLTVAGALVVDAGRLRDASGAFNTSWAANTANFRLRDTAAATTVNTQTGVLSLIQDTATDLNVQVANGTSLSVLDSGGNVTVSSPGDLTLTGSNFAVAGELTLDAIDNLQLSAAGLTVSNDLRINAANLSATGGGSPLLAGRNADLTLTGDQALALTTRLSQLGVTYAATGPFSLDNDRDLTLTRFAAPSVQTLGFNVNGTLTLPDAGLSAQQSLTVDAVDLIDSDRDLSLAAPQLAVRLSGASGNNAWAVMADELDVLMGGNASLTVTDAGGLTLADLNNDGQAVGVANGNFGLALASGDLTIAADVSAADLTDDDIRAGIVDLNVAQGDMLTQGPVEVTSINNLDQDAGTDTYGIRLRLTDSGTEDRSVTLGGATRLLAVGGDILIDTRPEGTAPEVQRRFVQTLGSVVEAYNRPEAPQNGVVLINGKKSVPSPGQMIRSGRTLAIVADVQQQGNILDELDNLDETTDVQKDVATSGPKAAAQFDKVFGTCDELDKKNQHRCRVDTALKAFLSHWLVGGEMPPKTEIR